MTKISALIITKNEEEHLAGALESVEWADEIVIVDSGSTDRTVSIAKKYTPKVYFHEWPGYSEQKNWGAAKCSNDWILSIDADERVPVELRREIEQRLSDVLADGYLIPTKDFMFGKWILHGGWYPQEHIRLYRKSKSAWGKNVHEVVTVEGTVAHLKSPIEHYGHTDIAEFVGKLNIYTQKEADKRFESGEHIYMASIVWRSFRVFLSRYIKQRGFRDGAHGYILAVCMSFYQFCSDVKLWEHWYRKNHVSA